MLDVGSAWSPRLDRTAELRWHLLCGVLLSAAAAVVAITFRDYGMTWDEYVQAQYAERLLRWYGSAFRDRSALGYRDLYLYGGFFEIVAQGITRLSDAAPLDTRHLVNAVFGLAAVVAACGIGTQVAGARAGFMSAVFLMLTPRFYGHMFNNPKDVPFAAAYGLALWAMLWSTHHLPRISVRRVLLLGLAAGLALAIRIGGLLLFLWLVSLWVLVLAASCSVADPSRPTLSWRRLGQLGVALLAVVALAWGVMLSFWPWAQVAPLRNPLAAAMAFSRFRDNLGVVFEGRLYESGHVPWYYLPKWLAMTLPEFHLVALLLGVALVVYGANRRTITLPSLRWVKFAWLGLVTLAPFLIVVMTRPPLYDGLRHFFFVLPGLAGFGGAAVSMSLSAVGGRAPRTLLTAVLAAGVAATVWDMVQLHPYQCVYFNRPSGGLAGAADRFETDYWGNSHKEGVEWLIRNYHSWVPIRVANTSEPSQTAYYLERDETTRARFVPVRMTEDPHVVLTTTRHRRHTEIAGRLLHTVKRQGTPLLYVFEVRRPDARPRSSR